MKGFWKKQSVFTRELTIGILAWLVASTATILIVRWANGEPFTHPMDNLIVTLAGHLVGYIAGKEAFLYYRWRSQQRSKAKQEELENHK